MTVAQTTPQKVLTFHTVKDKILVDPIIPPLESKEGIQMPKSAQKKATEGTVVVVGPDVENPNIVEGATVLFSDWIGSEVILQEGDAPLVILRESDISVIVREASPPE